jgi:hypothetical protein
VNRIGTGAPLRVAGSVGATPTGGAAEDPVAAHKAGVRGGAPRWLQRRPRLTGPATATGNGEALLLHLPLIVREAHDSAARPLAATDAHREHRRLTQQLEVGIDPAKVPAVETGPEDKAPSLAHHGEPGAKTTL